MATEAPPNPTTSASMNGTVGKLALRVISEPEGGSGVFFPAFPAGIALQLGALGVVLALLSCANAEIFNPAATEIILPVALAVGGVAITAGGIINFRAGIQIAGVIGVLYGVFWLSVGLLLQLSAGGLTEAAGPAGFGDAFGTYLLIWAVVSAYLAVATFFVNRIIFVQQTLLVIVFVFVGLAYAAAPGGSGLFKTGGWLGLIDAAIAMYISAALVVNDTAGRPVLPIA